MKKRRLKVLSIDFDFFQDVPLETVYKYPDGHDFGTYLSTMIWASHYVYPNDNIKEVSIDEENFSDMIEIIEYNADDEKPVLICNSHRHIYDFIKENYDGNIHNGIDITNVDMHHDLFNDNEDLDCGNWLSHIAREYKTSIRWIANKISKEAYSINTKKFDMVEENLKGLLEEDFDIIFLCRSDIWTPPHLDDRFTEMAERLISLFYDVRLESGILEERDYGPVVRQLKENMKNFEKEGY